MGKNDRMRMIRAALTRPAARPRLLLALLLVAAGSSAFAQAADAASAPEPAASVAASAVAPAPKARPLAKPVAPAALSSAPPATWSALTPKQQALLAPLERDWADIADSQRSKWLSATPTLATMSGEEIKRVHDRMRDWTRLSASERVNARIGFQVARQLTAEQRRARWEAYQALPLEERQALADKAMARQRAQAAGPVRAPKTLASQAKSNIVPAAPKLVNNVNQNQLIDIGNGFNNASANLYVNAQLAPGIRVALTSYLSSRHHQETWVKDGYLLIDESPIDVFLCQ